MLRFGFKWFFERKIEIIYEFVIEYCDGFFFV